MSREWDRTLKQWAETIDQNDEARGKAAAEGIRAAIRPLLDAGKKIDVRVTGSYRNNTNIRGDSDIDVAVVLHNPMFHSLPPDGSLTREMLGLRDSDYSFEAYRGHVGEALRGHFREGEVNDGNKAFDVRPSGARLDADVAVFMEHRRYTGKKRSDGTWDYHAGVEMRSRREPSLRIINWPEQHYDRGVAKNDATNGRFKRMVRIFKNLCVEMASQGNAQQKSAAGQVSSFFLECLVYNAPDDRFNQESGGYLKDMRAVLGWLGSATRPSADAPPFVEVSGMERLFRADTGRTREQAYAFTQAGWERIFAPEKPTW